MDFWALLVDAHTNFDWFLERFSGEGKGSESIGRGFGKYLMKFSIQISIKPVKVVYLTFKIHMIIKKNRLSHANFDSKFKKKR